MYLHAGPSMMWFFYACCLDCMHRFLKFPAWLAWAACVKKPSKLWCINAELCLTICRYACVFTLIAISSCWAKKTFLKRWTVISFHTVHGCGFSTKQEINLNEIRKLICSTRLVGPPRQIYFSISWLIKNSTDWGLNERQVTLPCDPST